MAVYRQTVRRRGEEEERTRIQRLQCAWEVARQAAALLKEEFHAGDVMVFGSLVHGFWFSKTSDVDIAARGLKESDYFIAVAKLQDLSSNFSVDLVAFEHCNPELRAIITREGVRL
jgi:predicted nucleotidyltransferase